MPQKFDTSFARVDCSRRERHGQIWTDTDYANLVHMFNTGATLKQMAEALMRPADGVINKLAAKRLIEFDPGTLNYYVTRHATRGAESQPQPINSTQEPAMTAPTIETKTFIQGEDAANLSDAQIFAKISSLEGQITKLDAIKTKPKKLVKVIEDLQADIAKLVEFVDAR